MACAVARTALKVLVEEGMIENAARMGAYLMEALRAIDSPHIREVRGKGLMIGVELRREAGGARRFCEALRDRGLLCKETHATVVRLAPPLIVNETEIEWAVAQVRDVLSEIDRQRLAS